MPTLSINSNRLDPIYARVMTHEESKAYEGKMYYVSTGFKSISPNEQLILQLGNPSESGIYMNIRKVIICSDVKSFISLYKNYQFIGNCTKNITPRNTNTTGFNNSVIIAKCLMPGNYLDIYDCDLLATYIDLGGTEIIDFGGALKFYSGSTLTVCMNSKSKNMSNLGITLIYSESTY